jgi:glycosyltransferase involved in cell wall biosynthesis
MNKPLVSIITPVKNGEKHLRQSIESVISQSYRNIEHVIIDGQSTDSTLDIIKEYEDKIAYWKSERDRGISDAFNKGIQECNGEIIGIINADDWYEKGAVENAVSTFSQYPATGVVCGSISYWDDKKFLYHSPSIPGKLKYRMKVHHPTVFVKKSIYKNFGFFREDFKYAMDYELLLRFYMAKVPFKSIPNVLANMRFGGKSDITWKKALHEVHRAKLLNNISPLSSLVSHWYFIVDRYVMLFLDSAGFEKIIPRLKAKLISY